MPEQSSRELRNRGLLTLNETPATAEATLVVLGVARGGTSLVAGVLDSLGVFLGDQSHPPVYEDLRLSRAFEERDRKRIDAVVDDYNARHRCWGWKRPGSVDYLDAAHARLRNPRYLVVFKDVFSIANRNRISMASDVLQGMRRGLDEYGKVLDFLHKRNPPALLVSYDKAIQDKQAFVDAVIGFCGLTVEPAARERALAFITRDPKAYLEATRADRIVGHLDVVTADEIAGWASLGSSNPAPLSVELWVNGRHRMSTLADRYRADLQQARVHVSGKAGYRFALDDDVQLQPGDRIQVFAGAERVELKNSPWIAADIHSPAVVSAGGAGATSSVEPLVFLHIPKTAGTSLRSMLRQQIPGEALVLLDPPLGSDHKAAFTRQLPQMQALLGHLYFGIDQQLGFHGSYATFLRDPVERVVSFWKHQQKHPHSAFHAQTQRMSLREFVDSGLTLQTDNHMTRILVGIAEPGMLDGSIPVISDRRYLQIALDHVQQRFCFVGFAEHFEASARGLYRAMGWPVERVPLKRLNVSGSTVDSLDDATLQAIRRHNELDLALYQTLLADATWLDRGAD